MDENINNVAPEANYEPSNESYSEPQQTYQDNYQEGTREPAQTTNDGSPSTFAIRVDPRTGRKSIVSIGEEPEEQQSQPPVVEQPRVDYTTPFNVPPRPQPQQNVVPQQNVAPPQPAKYQNAGEVVSAMQNGTLDESRIPVEMAFQYAQYKQAQQQQVAEQTPTPDNTDEQLKYRQQVLNKLRTRIELLQTPSSELMLQLETAKSELESCKQNLDLSMQNLVGAMNSISKLKTNLNQLKAKVSKLENQAKHRGQQRDKAYVGCGILLILLLV